MNKNKPKQRKKKKGTHKKQTKKKPKQKTNKQTKKQKKKKKEGEGRQNSPAVNCLSETDLTVIGDMSISGTSPVPPYRKQITDMVCVPL